jgi:hypothetical protein
MVVSGRIATRAACVAWVGGGDLGTGDQCGEDIGALPLCHNLDAALLALKGGMAPLTAETALFKKKMRAAKIYDSLDSGVWW